MSQNIDRHLELHLGPIARGWSPRAGTTGVQVVLFEDQPGSGDVTYSTLGLSSHVLAMPRGREVRQELLLAVGNRFADELFPKLLMFASDRLLDEHRALLRGEVLALGHPVRAGTGLVNLYVSMPVVFPEGLATCKETQPPTVFAWLLPIFESEAAMVGEQGWNRFEDALEREGLDLLDLDREPLGESVSGARSS